MMGDFEKYLAWRFGIIVVKKEVSLDEGYIMTFALNDAQYEKVLSQEKMFQALIFMAQSFIAENINLPFSAQRTGKITTSGKLLIVSGSDTFISAILYQLFGFQNQTAEEIYYIPLQNRINSSGDKAAIDFLHSLVLKDDTVQKFYIPADSLSNIKKQLNQSEYKNRLLISLKLSLNNLKAYCNGLDKARSNGNVIEYDTETESIDEFDMSDVNRKKIQYREYITTCRKFVTDANIYLDELGW